MSGKVITLDGIRKNMSSKPKIKDKGRCKWGKVERPWKGRVDLFGTCGNVGIDLVKDTSKAGGEVLIYCHYDSTDNVYQKTRIVHSGTKDLDKAKRKAIRLAQSRCRRVK